MLGVINESLNELIEIQNVNINSEDRIQIFKEIVGNLKFKRKDYMIHFSNISTATASRDLRKAVEKGILNKKGEYRLTEYYYK